MFYPLKNVFIVTVKKQDGYSYNYTTTILEKFQGLGNNIVYLSVLLYY